jgi:hypothetical protein
LGRKREKGRERRGFEVFCQTPFKLLKLHTNKQKAMQPKYDAPAHVAYKLLK